MGDAGKVVLDSTGGALHWCSKGPAVEPGEGHMGNMNEEEMLTSLFGKMTARRKIPWDCGSGL